MLFLTAWMSLCLFFLSPAVSWADSPESFEKAKRLASKLFSAKRETIYCGCPFNSNNKIDLDSCHMQAAKRFKRANRMEWEHIMAASFFGRHFRCWTERLCEHRGKRYRGRKCCEKIDSQYNHLAGELFNLWPSVGLINQLRSDYNQTELVRKKDSYGCEFAVDRVKRQVEPADSAKGIVARANLFMAQHYNIPLTAAQAKQFQQWHKQYPVSDWEKEWAAKVAQIEGYQNPFIPSVNIAKEDIGHD